MDGRTVVGWKDPRTSLTLPFWRTVAQIDVTVLVLRHPLEVVRSLNVRNAIEEEQAARLYLSYVLSALQNDPACVLVRYDDLFTDLEGQVDRLRAELGLRAPASEGREQLAALVKEPLRSTWLEPLAGEGTSAVAVAVYRLLSDGRRDEVLDLADPLLDWATRPD
jgi:hypothetical protein